MAPAVPTGRRLLLASHGVSARAGADMDGRRHGVATPAETSHRLGGRYEIRERADEAAKSLAVNEAAQHDYDGKAKRQRAVPREKERESGGAAGARSVRIMGWSGATTDTPTETGRAAGGRDEGNAAHRPDERVAQWRATIVMFAATVGRRDVRGGVMFTAPLLAAGPRLE